MNPLWFFFFANPESLFLDATVAAPSREEACLLLDVVMKELDPKNPVHLRKHPTGDYLWTGDSVAMVHGGQAAVPEGVCEATDRKSGARMLYIGRENGASIWRKTEEQR